MGGKGGGKGGNVVPGSAEDLLMQMVNQKQTEVSALGATPPKPALPPAPSKAVEIMDVGSSPEPERGGTKKKAAVAKAASAAPKAAALAREKSASSSSSSSRSRSRSKSSSSSDNKKKKRTRSSNFTSLRRDAKHRKKA